MFRELSPHIHAIETGLSSDPEMNWSFLDLTHHPPFEFGCPFANRLEGANAFDCALDYRRLLEAIRKKDGKKILYTVEFFQKKEISLRWPPQLWHHLLSA